MPTRTALIGTIAIAGSALTAGVAFAKPAPVTVSGTRDAKITRELRQRLSAQQPISKHRIRIQTKHGVVTLSGLAESGEAELQAVHDAQEIPGVKQVKDDLRIVS